MASGEPGVGVAAPLAAAPVLLDEVFVVAVEEAMAIFVSPKRRTLRARDGSGRKRGGHRLFNRGSINNFRAICRWRPSRGHSICGAKLVTGQSATMALPVVTNEKGHRSRTLASGMSNGATTNVVSSIWDVLIFFLENGHAPHGMIGSGGIGNWVPTHLFQAQQQSIHLKNKARLSQSFNHMLGSNLVAVLWTYLSCLWG